MLRSKCMENISDDREKRNQLQGQLLPFPLWVWLSQILVISTITTTTTTPAVFLLLLLTRSQQRLRLYRLYYQLFAFGKLEWACSLMLQRDFLKSLMLGFTHSLEKVAPWSVISGSFAVCISPLNLDTAGNNV